MQYTLSRRYHPCVASNPMPTSASSSRPGSEAIVVLGGPSASSSGLCGESAFAASDCAFDRKGTTLKCKR